MNSKQLAATNKAIKKLGGLAAVAKRYRTSMQAVQNWRTRGIPRLRVKEIAEDSGVAREALRPDIYG